MMHTYKVRATSWGVIITVDILEIKAPMLTTQDIQVAENIYLRISELIRLKNELVLEYFSPVFKKYQFEIMEKSGSKPVCFFVQSIDYDPTDFQLEGLYCVVEEWLSKYYDLGIPPVKVIYNKFKNRYDFEIPIKG